jgi:hypothetical protein
MKKATTRKKGVKPLKTKTVSPGHARSVKAGSTLQAMRQIENRQFTTISNVVKTRHDDSTNTINNVK